MPHDLYHAPPRISDLRGDDLRTALFHRHDEAKRNWLAERGRRGLVRRLLDRIGA